jgi:hypothetical protein
MDYPTTYLTPRGPSHPTSKHAYFDAEHGDYRVFDPAEGVKWALPATPTQFDIMDKMNKRNFEKVFMRGYGSAPITKLNTESWLKDLISTRPDRGGPPQDDSRIRLNNFTAAYAATTIPSAIMVRGYRVYYADPEFVCAVAVWAPEFGCFFADHSVYMRSDQCRQWVFDNLFGYQLKGLRTFLCGSSGVTNPTSVSPAPLGGGDAVRLRYASFVEPSNDSLSQLFMIDKGADPYGLYPAIANMPRELPTVPIVVRAIRNALDRKILSALLALYNELGPVHGTLFSEALSVMDRFHTD